MHSNAGVYIYHCKDRKGILIIILYINDITLLGDSSKKITQMKSTLASHYEMTNLGEIESYLRVCITCDCSIRCLDINQSQYVHEIVEHFSMVDANPVQTPLLARAEVHLVKHIREATASKIKYFQQIIGSLLYVQIGTQPDILFAVTCLVQYASNPLEEHLCLAKYVLRYLKGSVDLRLQFDEAQGDGLHGYLDFSLGDQSDDYHSTSGYVFMLASAAISWTSHKQKTVAQSTTEAEYMALTEASNQSAWYQAFLLKLGYETPDLIPLYRDNKGTVDLVLNPVTERWFKHIPIKHHAIRKYVECRVIKLICTLTADMLADGFMKLHAHLQLQDFTTGLGLVD